MQTLVPDRFGFLRPTGDQHQQETTKEDSDGGDSMGDQMGPNEGDEPSETTGQDEYVNEGHSMIEDKMETEEGTECESLSNPETIWGAFRPSSENLALMHDQILELEDSILSRARSIGRCLEESEDFGKLFGGGSLEEANE